MRQDGQAGEEFEKHWQHGTEVAPKFLDQPGSNQVRLNQGRMILMIFQETFQESGQVWSEKPSLRRWIDTDGLIDRQRDPEMINKL